VSSAKYDAVAKTHLNHFTPRTVLIGRALVVDGMPPLIAKKEFNLHINRIYTIRTKVLTAINEVPTNWRHVNEWAPPRLAAKFQRETKRARAKLNGKRRRPAAKRRRS